jgi:hypothetical protein
MPAKLLCRDLEPGDLMLKVSDGSVIGKLIQFGQAARGGANPGIVHAGIMFDRTFIIESQGGGISANDLRLKNRHYGYYVFRCGRADVAAGAGTCAKMMFDIHQRGRNLGYSVSGAVGSLLGKSRGPASRGQMDTLLDRILEGKNHRFFCSQFVVYVFQFVAEQCGTGAATLFPFSDAKVPPSQLAAHLQNHPLFTEAGWLFPNER